MKIFQPSELWKIATFEKPSNNDTFRYLTYMLEKGKWDQVEPIWIYRRLTKLSSNCDIDEYETLLFQAISRNPLNFLKPYLSTGGHHRLTFAKRHYLSIKSYIIGEKGNPDRPYSEMTEYGH